MHTDNLMHPRWSRKVFGCILVEFVFPTLRNCRTSLQLWCIPSAASSETVPGQAGVADHRVESPNLQLMGHPPKQKKRTSIHHTV